MDGIVKGTPCEVVIKKGEVLFIAEEVAGEFPDDPDLVKLGITGYIAIPFKDSSQTVFGHLAVMDRKPLHDRKASLSLMRIFAFRAAAELWRIRAELPPDLQAKLLRVLQEGEFEPVGSAETRSVDVRVIAATNRNLKTEAAAGRFREDLFFRLSVFPLTLPPLRERGDDVLLLAQAFADKASRRMGRTIHPLSPLDRERLKRYAWPGNVRELQNVIERAVITAEGGRLNLDRALPETAMDAPPAGRAEHDGGETATPILKASELRALERRNLLRA